MVFQEGHYCISCHSHTGHYLTDTMAILHDRHISEEVAHASSRGGCARITKRHESSTLFYLGRTVWIAGMQLCDVAI